MVERHRRPKPTIIPPIVVTPPTVVTPPPPATPPATGVVYLFQDEFDGAAGTGPDPTKWVFDTGGPGSFGNNELETYVDSLANCFVDGDSVLHLRALNPSAGKYTSARIKTLGKFSHYGRTWESRIKWPTQDGFWPAWWMMGSNPDQWPASGEVDIFEVYGNGWAPGSTVWTPNSAATAMESSQSADFVNDGDWHTWRFFYDEPGTGNMIFHKDGVLYLTATPGPGWCYSNGNPLYTLLNLAVGGSGGGAVPAGAEFPVDLLVDYVRCW